MIPAMSTAAPSQAGVASLASLNGRSRGSPVARIVADVAGGVNDAYL